MISTTVILCMVFAACLISPVRMLFNMVLMSILGLSVALLCDFTLTPILIYVTKPFGKEKIPE